MAKPSGDVRSFSADKRDLRYQRRGYEGVEARDQMTLYEISYVRSVQTTWSIVVKSDGREHSAGVIMLLRGFLGGKGVSLSLDSCWEMEKLLRQQKILRYRFIHIAWRIHILR
jgi:hypothetical protein